MRQSSKKREPSLLRQVVSVYYEQAKRRKALRLLERQSWSFEFLCAMLRSAAREDSGVSLTITSRDGTKVELTARQAASTQLPDGYDDIFNHLDSDAAVDSFIRRYGR